MKKSLLSLVAALGIFATSSAFALQESPIPLANRATGVTVFGTTQYARDSGVGPRDGGIIVSLSTTAIAGGAPTVLVTIQGRTPAGEWWDVGASAAIVVAAGVPSILYLRPDINPVANVNFGLPLPPVFRMKAVVGGTGNATFSVGVSRVN